jgi:hypothetical protein
VAEFVGLYFGLYEDRKVTRRLTDRQRGRLQMSIVRRHHNRNFTIVPNAIFEDARLSAEAKGTLGYLLSRPHDWIIRLPHIGAVLKIGRDRTERIFQELVDAGYVVRGKQSRSNGVWGPREFIVYDDPACGSSPCPGKPSTAGPSTANKGTYQVLKETKTDSTKAADDVRAREPSKSLISDLAFEVTTKVLALQNLDSDDPRAIGTAYTVQGRLNKGWEGGVILQAVEVVMVRLGKAPRSPKYFEQAIAEAHAERNRPLPVATNALRHPQGTNNGKPTIQQASLALVDKMRAIT